MKATFNLPATLNIADQDPATQTYQAVEMLEFHRDAMANAVLIDEFVLDGDFKAIDINVLDKDAPIKAQLEKPDAITWILRLPRPFRLQKINIQPLQQDKDRTSGAGQVDIFPVIGDKVMSQSIASMANSAQINDLILEAFAVRAKDSIVESGNDLMVAQHSISVYVHSQPQGLSLGLAPVTNDVPALEEVTELSGFNLASNQDSVPLRDSADIWSSGLQDFLDDNFKTSGDSEKFKLAVVFRSENPCQFESESSDNAYRLLFRDLATFPDIDPENPDSPLAQKQAFTGTQWQSFYYPLTLPANSILRSAVLPFKHTLKKNAFSFVDTPPSEKSLATAKAVQLTSEQWAGGLFQLSSAQSVRYLLLPLMALQADTICALEIREDINGFPSGSIVTRQSLHIGDVGKRVWMSVPLDDAVPLYSEKLWWLVKTTQGEAIQFGADSPQGSGISHFSLSESGGPGTIFRFTPELSVTPIFAKDKSDGGEKLHAFVAEGNNWLALNSSAIPAGKLNQFDLLQQLPDQNQATVTTITLRLASLLKGNVKLYPPEISYELVE